MSLPKTRLPISAAEFEKCKWDVERWAWVFLGIRFHPGQVRFANAYLKRTDSRWRAFYLWLLVSAGNRAGKTLTLSVIILHSCVYRMGLKPPDNTETALRHWARIPYHWWHFAVEQGPAEQVFIEIATILGGVHPAQKEGCPWADTLGEGDASAGARRIASATETEGIEWTNGVKERGEYAWIKLAAEFGGAQIHFRSTKAKALSAIGQNMHGLSFDEAGLEPNLQYLLEEVMHARRLGTGGQFFVISTPSVATSTDFQDLWTKGDPEDPFREKRRFSMRMSSRENIGFGLDEESFYALIEGQPADWIRQNIDGEFIQAFMAFFNKRSVDSIFHPDLPEEEAPRIGSIYLQALDPGLKDKCWSLVFRVTRDRRAIGVSIARQDGKQTTRGIINLGVSQHHKYQMWTGDDKVTGEPLGEATAMTGVDTTALGGHMFRDLIGESIPGVVSVEFGGNIATKRKLLGDLKVAIDEGRIIMPTEGEWREANKQLGNYRLLDRKIEQDIVMALAIIAKMLRTAPTDADEPAAPFEYGVADAPEESKDGINPRTVRAQHSRRTLDDQREAILATSVYTEQERELMVARIDADLAALTARSAGA